MLKYQLTFLFKLLFSLRVIMTLLCFFKIESSYWMVDVILISEFFVFQTFQIIRVGSMILMCQNS